MNPSIVSQHTQGLSQPTQIGYLTCETFPGDAHGHHRQYFTRNCRFTHLFHAKNADKIYHMKATETSTVGQLEEMAQSVRADMGDGPSLEQQVELKGKVVCEHPLQGQFTERPAVVVKTKIVREYEEYKESRDGEGKITAAGSNDQITAQ